jgi:hypothetical protein
MVIDEAAVIMSDSSDKPKIIIDEDWKSRVQAEKEAAEKDAREKQHAPDVFTSEGPSTATGANPRGELPPATFAVLLSTLATQALMALGQLPHPATGKSEVQLEEAKHFIDLLEMLEQKTTGNCTPDESKLLENLLHELRMAFIRK